jgi:polyhydroxyalkanoate synthesis regulator phasin
MKELLKNMLYTGVGAAFLTRDKVDEIRKELVERGKLTKEEGKEFVDDLIKKSDCARNQLEIWLNRQVEERIQAMEFATSAELNELRNKVEELEAALQTTLKSKEEEEPSTNDTCESSEVLEKPEKDA